MQGTARKMRPFPLATWNLPGLEQRIVWSAAAGRDEAVLAELPPAWRLLMLQDGSATRSLTLLTGETIVAELANVSEVTGDPSAPPELTLLGRPHLRRSVVLKTRSGTLISYAVSWWNKSDYEAFLKNPTLPIGTNMRQARTEYCREMCSLFLAEGPALTERFHAEGPFLGRHYVMRHNDRPLNVIVEIYAPSIAYHLDATGWYPRWTGGAPTWNDARSIAAETVARPDFSLRAMQGAEPADEAVTPFAPRIQLNR